METEQKWVATKPIIVAEPEVLPVKQSKAITLGLLGADNPAELISAASAVATELKKVVIDAKLSQNIQGKEYVKVEGWTTLGMLLGLLPREVSTEAKDDGSYVSTVAFCRPDGSIVTQASAECGDETDGKWAQRPPYARRSMAQTRATGKAARLAFSWIMALAGYAPTPAEEMPLEADKEPLWASKKEADTVSANILIAFREGDTAKVDTLVKELSPEQALDIWKNYDAATRAQIKKDLQSYREATK